MFATVAAPVPLLGGVGACDRRGDVEPGRATTVSSAPAAGPTVRYVYGGWSEWQVDCLRRAADPNVPCAAVRKRICLIEGTSEGVACDRCGGQCKEEIADKSSPLYIYAEWSNWTNNCPSCSPEPKPCKAERTRFCIARATGTATDCEVLRRRLQGAGGSRVRLLTRMQVDPCARLLGQYLHDRGPQRRGRRPVGAPDEQPVQRGVQRDGVERPMRAVRPRLLPVGALRPGMYTSAEKMTGPGHPIVMT